MPPLVPGASLLCVGPAGQRAPEVRWYPVSGRMGAAQPCPLLPSLSSLPFITRCLPPNWGRKWGRRMGARLCTFPPGSRGAGRLCLPGPVPP